MIHGQCMYMLQTLGARSTDITHPSSYANPLVNLLDAWAGVATGSAAR